MKSISRGSSLNAGELHAAVGKYALGEDVKQSARRTICARAADTAEAIELLKMLGIHPGQSDSELDDVFPAFNTPRKLS